MKSNTKKIIILLVLGMGFVFLPNIKLDFDYGHKSNVKIPKQSAGYTVSFIHVDGNWSATESIYSWCSGDGSWGNPYTIENVIIDAPTGSGIFINNSKNDYFIIRNCTVYNAGGGVYDGGIKLENSNNGTLTNNNCSNNQNYGILVFNFCDNNTLSGNTAFNNTDTGILFISNCNNNTISGNTANNNTRDGMYLSESDYNKITGNTANNNTWDGIRFDFSCDNNTISRNTASDNNLNGIQLSQCDYNIITGNTASDNTFNGINLLNSNNNTILENIANDNIQYGIYLYQSKNNTISGNTANGNQNGIYLETSCDFNTFSGNTANGNQYGIFFYYDCDNNTISGNIACNNTLYGIILTGIPIGTCDNNTLSENTASNNDYVGICLGHSNDNILHENFFLKNGIHAIDDGTDNKWNSTTIGNYWDNHTGPDTNPKDGIVDIQYNISGSAESIDYLPIAEDGAPVIVINSPTSSDVFGENAPSFDVIITDDYLDEMWYTLDGGINNYTFIENGIINQTAWAAKTEGSVTITFYAIDIPRNIGIAEVSVVKDTTAPIIVINSPTDAEEFGTQAPLFNITVIDDHLDSMWYSLDGGVTTYVFTNNTVFNQTAWTALSEGDVTITFYARDLAGNEASEAVTVVKTASGLDPGIVIVIVVVSVVGGVAVISVIYIFMKKRATPA